MHQFLAFYTPYPGSFALPYSFDTGQKTSENLQTRSKVREMSAAHISLLWPALGGTGVAFLLAFLTRPNRKGQGDVKSKRKGAGLIIFSGITTAAISSFIYRVMLAANGHIIEAYYPVSGAIGLQILFYGAIYLWLYRMDAESFSGNIPEKLYDELITFIYFSITTFATAGMGDIAPITSTAKILVSLQVIFFVFIFTMGLVFHTNL